MYKKFSVLLLFVCISIMVFGGCEINETAAVVTPALDKANVLLPDATATATAVAEVTEQPTEAPTAVTVIMYVSGSNVNVRAEADVGSARLTSLALNSRVEVFGETGDWYYISYAEGSSGYIKKEFLSDKPVA